MRACVRACVRAYVCVRKSISKYITGSITLNSSLIVLFMFFGKELYYVYLCLM